MKAFDHVALWVDERDDLARFLCDVCGMHEIERTDSFTLVGGNAREGKLTLFEADGPRAQGVIEQIVLRVPDLVTALARARATGRQLRANGQVAIEAPGNVPLGLIQAETEYVDLDHVIVRVPDPESASSAFGELGFRRVDDRLEVGDRHLLLRPGSVEHDERPLLNHFALLVESVDETLKQAEALKLEVDRIVDAPNTLAAFVVGPDGIVVEYVEHKPGFSLV
ncbi:MAG: VOC family protein [Gaiella sp.]